MEGDSESYDDDSEVTLTAEEALRGEICCVKSNNPYFKYLRCTSNNDAIQNFTNEQWEQLGRDISNNTHLECIDLSNGLIDDKMSFFFGGLTGSKSIQELIMRYNGFSASGVRSMVPFLQHATKLRKLFIYWNHDLQSEGFNVVLRALRDSPIEQIFCSKCGIETIEIDDNNFPKMLQTLSLNGNNISTDGCREIAKLLQRGDSALTCLSLSQTKIGDEGVAVLVDALQNNTSLKELSLSRNDGISIKGRIELSKLVIDLSSVEATLQSNHTLERVDTFNTKASPKEVYLEKRIEIATSINKEKACPGSAGEKKVISTQLHSVSRASLAEFQGVSHSVYSEIDPLHLPEVLSLVRQIYGFEELYAALKLSIATLISMVDTKQRIKQNMSHYAARLEKLRAEVAYCMGRSEEMNENLAIIKAAEGNIFGTKTDDEDASRPSKRSRA